MAHITEKRLYAVSPQPLISNGTTLGRVQVADACNLFVVGQLVILQSSTQPAIRLKIKRMPDDTTLLLGPDNEPVQKYSDVSAYLLVDGATLEAPEQLRPSVPEQEIERLTYAEEPAIARRVILVDHCGIMIGPDNPLPVDAVINVGTLNVDIDAKDGDNTAISAHPAPIFAEFSDTLIAAGYKEVFSYTSTDSLTRIIAIIVAGSTSLNILVKINGVIKRVHRTSATERQAEIIFREHRPLPSGIKITVEVEAERFLTNNSPYAIFTTLEGYLA